VLAPTNGILSGVLQSVSALLITILTNQHLQMQHSNQDTLCSS